MLRRWCTCRHYSSSPSTSYFSHNELRQTFVDYFARNGHKIVKSASLKPNEADESVLFTNAGMNQFKPIILNGEKPQKLANIQKCIRAGGKHNDLDDVGKDFHHHTFFEMMGNWSFNNAYSKEDACEFAWKFLCETLKIPQDRLYVSYFAGSSGLAPDLECRRIWTKLGVAENRILPFSGENFWEMGASGPCGPSTEIHFDRIGSRNAENLVNRHDSVVEIWNIVFMDKLRTSTGEIKSLGRSHIDTGMGLERILAVCQGKSSNFDTDVFSPIIAKICELSKMKYLGELNRREDQAIRLVADHIRAVAFAISDRIVPDQVDAGFVVRKMLRRMFIESSEHLGFERGQLEHLVPIVVDTMKFAYPELEDSQQSIIAHISKEDHQFWTTVDKAKKIFFRIVENTKGDTISGIDAFTLFDAHGLPLSITEELARNAGKRVDQIAFEYHRNEARKISKNASKFTLKLDSREFPTHSDRCKYDYRIQTDGKYVFPKISTRILAMFDSAGKPTTKLSSAAAAGSILVENCQFYAEQGGQASDYGILKAHGKPIFVVESARKNHDGKLSVLYGKCVESLEIGEIVEQNIDEGRRCGLMRSHSATHLLNYALKRFNMSNGQKGSSVESDRLRFDYGTRIEWDKSKLADVERFVQNCIESARRAEFEEFDIDEARRIPMIADEMKADRIVGERIRVVRLGDDEDCIECCAGTHVLNTKSIEDFAILAEKSMGRNLRRIFAVTGEEARKCWRYVENLKQLEAIHKNDIDWRIVPISQMAEINSIVKRKKKMKS
ncbi:unnamed protein product [Caenorhabditis bovis]|uniref:Alanine--tRNA ligase n=1 Tax=Caenorhabditis bovis TaxID=2654633 RepID=A0A8S1EME1_9PELO|nr:unnamed protein product [Caenorhabditis bovis]